FVGLRRVYRVRAFTGIPARAFADTLSLPDGRSVAGGGVAASSALYLGLGLAMGLATRFLKLPLWPAPVFFPPLVGAAIWFGQQMPFTLPALGGSQVRTWDYLILA